jgi:hypothetical protein
MSIYSPIKKILNELYYKKLNIEFSKPQFIELCFFDVIRFIHEVSYVYP